MVGHSIYFYGEVLKIIPKLSLLPFLSRALYISLHPGTTPSSTSTTQAQSIPPDFLQGFVESIMQSAGKCLESYSRGALKINSIQLRKSLEMELQKLQTLIRLLFHNQSDLGLHCLPEHFHEGHWC